MTIFDLRQALTSKTIAFELALESEKPRAELLKLYKAIKELQLKILEAELNELDNSRAKDPV